MKLCLKCGAEAVAPCGCGAPLVTHGKRAEAAVQAAPERSDHAIAADIGVSVPTIGRARLRLGMVQDVRKGLDGKLYSMPERNDRLAAAMRRVPQQTLLDGAAMGAWPITLPDPLPPGYEEAMARHASVKEACEDLGREEDFIDVLGEMMSDIVMLAEEKDRIKGHAREAYFHQDAEARKHARDVVLLNLAGLKALHDLMVAMGMVERYVAP
jgi:hypothetical protein